MQTIITNLKRASVEIILLSLLCEEPMYGYQLAQEIKKRSNGQFSLMEASMYPVLGRLKEQGDVTMETVQKTPKSKRVYYHITEMGAQPSGADEADLCRYCRNHQYDHSGIMYYILYRRSHRKSGYAFGILAFFIFSYFAGFGVPQVQVVTYFSFFFLHFGQIQILPDFTS